MTRHAKTEETERYSEPESNMTQMTEFLKRDFKVAMINKS